MVGLWTLTPPIKVRLLMPQTPAKFEPEIVVLPSDIRTQADVEREYRREIVLSYYRKRRQAAIQLLGGKCVQCGATSNLQLDHIDPKTKTLDFGKSSSCSKAKWDAELKKAQLLCASCHIRKTREERGQKDARQTHGTLSSYRYCKCQKCKAAHAEYTRKYREARRKL